MNNSLNKLQKKKNCLALKRIEYSYMQQIYPIDIQNNKSKNNFNCCRILIALAKADTKANIIRLFPLIVTFKFYDSGMVRNRIKKNIFFYLFQQK